VRPRRPDVVDLEKVVVYQPFYNVEQSPPKENPAPHGPGHNGSRGTVDLACEQHESNEHGGPRERVEEAIPERVPLQPSTVSTGSSWLIMWCHLVEKDAAPVEPPSGETFVDTARSAGPAVTSMCEWMVGVTGRSNTNSCG
jgi:hypothetical protein